MDFRGDLLSFSFGVSGLPEWSFIFVFSIANAKNWEGGTYKPA
jgi:hypothetical protein